MPEAAGVPPGLKQFVADAAARLQAAERDSPRLSAEILLAHALGIERSELLKLLILTPDAPIPEKAYTEASALLAGREKGEPAAYLIGKKEFYGSDFSVNPHTLIPRPETELLVETALEQAKLLPDTAPRVFADLGTGSGCIAVTLARHLPNWTGIAVDADKKALCTARHNAEALSADGLLFLVADFTQPLFAPHSLSLFCSNPPYISSADYPALDPEVRCFEPESALVPRPVFSMRDKQVPPPQADGLEHIRILVAMAETALITGGFLLIEIGAGQQDQALALLSPACWTQTRVLPDLAGLPRLLSACRTPVC